jgi:hypothetical protein
MTGRHPGAKVALRKATAGDFGSVYALLLDFNNSKLTKDNWSQLFKSHWNFDEGDEDYYGYIMLENDQPIGFMSTIFSLRQINNNHHKFCNLSSWIVKEGYRNRSLYLVQPLLQLKDYTITLFTPSKTAQNIFKKLGYKELDSAERIILAIPQVSSFFKNETQITIDRGAIKELLSENELKIFQDHAGFKCVHVMITSDTGNLYIIMRRVIRKHLPFAHIHYVSNFENFFQNLKTIRSSLALKLKVVGFIIDERYVHDRNITFSIIRYPRITLYKSPVLGPKEIDSLYSEYFLLDL